MRILMVGDIVGNPGRSVFARTVTRLRAEKSVDFVVANAENAAGGKGITRPMAEELFSAGADVLTLGDHAWDQREFVNDIKSLPAVVRAANMPPGGPGRGFVTIEKNGVRVTVIMLVGRVFMNPMDCPFRTADAILTKEPNLGKIILVDMHAEATSEKIAMSRFLDGRVSAVCGTHTHVQTADERIMPGGTGAITDLGMTGPKDSVIGRSAPAVLQSFLTGMPSKFEVGTGDVEMDGVMLDVDEATGRCRTIKRFREIMAK
jgi:metallophosphoesterase (TIGR00282 family)